jgi:hypothetical protein
VGSQGEGRWRRLGAKGRGGAGERGGGGGGVRMGEEARGEARGR